MPNAGYKTTRNDLKTPWKAEQTAQTCSRNRRSETADKIPVMTQMEEREK